MLIVLLICFSIFILILLFSWDDYKKELKRKKEKLKEHITTKSITPKHITPKSTTPTLPFTPSATLEISKKTQKYGGDYFTRNGDIVKSKGEKYIADFFFKNKINYEYEKGLEIEGSVVAYPDFYLTDYDIYVEFFGLEGIKEYDEITKYKKRKHRLDELKVVYLYPRHIYSKYGFFEELLEKVFIKQCQDLNIQIKELKKSN